MKSVNPQLAVTLLTLLCVVCATAYGADGLVLHMSFNQGTIANGVATDLSSQGNDGLVTGDPQVVEGVLGDALEFDGTDDFIEVPLQPSITFGQGDSLSVMAWVKTSVHPSLNDGIVGNYRTSTTAVWALLANDVAGGVTLFLRDVDGTTSRLDSPDPIDTDTWIHVAGVRDQQTKEAYLYVDGEVVASMSDETENVNSGQSIWIGDHLSRFYDGLMDDVRIYNVALGQAAIQQAMKGTTELASAPSPENEAIDVTRDALLTWEPGQFAGTHDVYFGTVFNDVNDASRAQPLNVSVSQGQAATTYDPDGPLEFGQTYYWRIDEVNAAPDNTIFKGEVWSFTVEPLAYPIAGVVASDSVSGTAGDAQNAVNGSGLNDNDEHSVDSVDMWLAMGNGVDPVWIQFAFDRLYKLHQALVWNYNVVFEPVLGFGLKDVTVEYSADGVDWIALGDVEFAQATAAPDYAANTTVDFGGVAAQFVRFTVNSGFGALPQYGLSEVRFLQIAATAREPQPADGAVDVTPDAVLSWRTGRGAAVHNVYFGTDPDTLPQVDTATDSAYDPGPLGFGTTYTWRIDEVNEAEAIPVWEGDLWSFATQEYAVIDDMESYDDEDNTIFDTWLDGFVNETGSTVGYFEAPFAERTIVNSGSQSMPLEYANDAAPFYSEAEYDLGGMDLDANGADILRLFVAGQDDNAPEPLYVALEDTSGNVAVVTHPDGNITTTLDWTEWLIPYSELAGVNLGRVAFMYIGVGDRDNPTAGGTGLIFIDDIGYGHPTAVE